jgi:type II secretory ATPase GspE/PulE/Tfp pilus assembly ATPase PilB-like protein
MMMNIFGFNFGSEQKQPPSKRKATGAHAHAHGHANAPRKHHAPAPPVKKQVADEQTIYETYASLPDYIKVISGKGDFAASLPHAEDKLSIVVINTFGKNALLLHTSERVGDSLLGAVQGGLVQADYDALPPAITTKEVIAQIYASASMDGVVKTNGSNNAYSLAIRSWIEYAVKNRATDIHIECSGTSGVVRFRIDGDLEAMRSKDMGQFPASFVIKCMASLFNNQQQAKSGNAAMFEESKFGSCMVPYLALGHNLKLRYQSLKGNDGPKVVLRLLFLDQAKKTLTFEELGYAKSHIQLWESTTSTPSGGVFIAGVTGSGKSTTLKSFIELNPDLASTCVFTVEDPVEYPIKGAHQIPIQRELGNEEESSRVYNMAVGSLMRADPDWIALGEIRDKDSANAMQQFAETGHMALGTTHANLISGIVPRLINTKIGMTRDVLTAPNMLTLLVYQALVPKLCPSCCHTSVESVNSPSVYKAVEQFRKMGANTKAMRWKRIGGCASCDSRGTIGLTVVAEMLMPEEDWLCAIRDGKDLEALQVYLSKSDNRLDTPDMTGKTVFEHTLYKAQLGLVDARQCSRFDGIERFTNKYLKRFKN